MHLGPRALRALAADVDGQHRAGMHTFRDDAAAIHLGAEHADGRRSFLRRVAAGGAALTLGSAVMPFDRLLPAAGAQALADADLIVFAESIELTLIEAYEAGADLFDSEVLPIARLFAQHHREHADVFAELAGDQAASGPNQSLSEALAPIIEGLSGQGAMVRFVRDLENQTAATYGWMLTIIEGREAATGVATILPIESAHATVLGSVLGDSIADLFPTGPFESTDIAQGFDPAVFPAGA